MRLWFKNGNEISTATFVDLYVGHKRLIVNPPESVLTDLQFRDLPYWLYCRGETGLVRRAWSLLLFQLVSFPFQYTELME